MLVLLSILRRSKYQVRIVAVVEYTKERMNGSFPIFLLLELHKIHHH